MHGSLIKVVVYKAILTDLARNPARYMGGKLAIGCHPDTIPICARYQNQARSDGPVGPPETTRAAIVLLPLACDQFSLLSAIYIRALWGLS